MRRQCMTARHMVSTWRPLVSNKAIRGQFMSPLQSVAFTASSRQSFRAYPSRRYGGLGFHSTLAAANTFTWSVIGLNVVIWLGLNTMKSNTQNPSQRDPPEKALENFTISMKNIQSQRYHTILTSAFAHYDLPHLVVNMMSLRAFSSALMYMSGIGSGHLAGLMLSSAISGSVGYLIQKKLQNANDNEAALGASGVVMGLGAAASLLSPNTTMLLLGVVPVPLWLLIGGYAAYDMYYLSEKSRIAHSGHLGGLAAGTIYYFLALRRFGGVGRLFR